MRKMKYILMLGLLLWAGCTLNESDEQPDSKKIYLGVEGLETPAAKSRAAVDEWDNTAVGIAYAYAPSTLFNKSLTVSVTDGNGEHINTGMEYPMSASNVSFIGYHPATTPSATGDVTFDLRNGDVDVMMSNTLTGNINTPITDKMVFEHQLTRFVFEMQCKAGESYPEPVCGVSVSAGSSTPLMTYVMLDLNSGTPVFKIPGTVFNGTTEGQPVPQNLGDEVEPLVFDVMVQPGVPLDFKVVTLTDVKNITITSDPGSVWHTLTTVGGEVGKQYTIQLQFSGEIIMKQGITVTNWKGNTPINEGTTPTWW